MGERGFGIKADIHKESWETEEFPQLCETCLGENPYVRMMKEKFGKSCKICERPFTIFRWKPGKKARYKKTEICQLCAKMKNVCQTCVLDLQYGLPVQVRDTFLAQNEKQMIPLSDANREWHAQQYQKTLEEKGIQSTYDNTKYNDSLIKLARKLPYYERNRPHLCSFYARGECTRGDACPYLHEMPKHNKNDPLSIQNIKDRFHGNNDPVAKKILGKRESIEKTNPLSLNENDTIKLEINKKRKMISIPPPPPPPPLPTGYRIQRESLNFENK